MSDIDRMTPEQLIRAAEIKRQLTKLQDELAFLRRGKTTTQKQAANGRADRHFSRRVRAKLSEMALARWKAAKKQGKTKL